MNINEAIMVSVAIRSSVIASFRAPSTAPGSGLLTLPSWMTISCPTSGRTVQTSAISLARGLAANAARARDVGFGCGLSVESTRTQMCWQSESFTGTQWATGTMTKTLNQADPAGGTLATLFTSSGNQYGDYSATPGNWRVTSAWLKGASGTPPYCHFRSANAAPWLDLAASQWARYDIVNAIDAVGSPNVETRNIPAGAGIIAGATSMLACFCQAEAGVAYPSSYLPQTLSTSLTRTQDVLVVNTPTLIAPDGYYDILMVVAPNYASTEFLADHPWLYWGPGSQTYLKQSDRTIRLQIPGVADLVTPALTFAREHAFIVRSTHMPAGRRLQVWNQIDGTLVYDSGLQAAAVPIFMEAQVGVLGNGTTTPECADLKLLVAFRASPPWTPRNLPNVRFLLEALAGVTTVDAVVVAPSDFTNATWVKAGCVATSATQLTIDNSTGPHFAYQVAGLRAGYPCTYYAEFKAGAGIYGVFTENNNVNAIVNITTGAVIVQTNCVVTVGTMDAGGYRPITVKTGPLGQGYIAVGFGTAGGTYTFTGNGTDTLFIRNESVTQRAVSMMTDQLGKYSASIVTSPTDISTASWIKTGLTPVTATQLRDSVDGAIAGHSCVTVMMAVSNLNRPATVAMELSSGTLRFFWISIGGGCYCYVDAATGAVGAVTQGTCTSALNPSTSRWVFTLTTTAAGNVAPNVYIYSAKGTTVGNANYQYQGDGTGTINVWNVTTSQPIAVLQAIAANRAALLYDANGRPVIWWDGVNDSAFGAIAGLQQPCTILSCGYWGNAYAANSTMFDGLVGNDMRFYRSAAGTGSMYAGANMVRNIATSTQVHDYASVFDGAANGQLWQDGAQSGVAGNVGTAAETGLTIGAFGSGAADWANLYLYALIRCDSALSAADIQKWHQWCRTNYGVP